MVTIAIFSLFTQNLGISAFLFWLLFAEIKQVSRKNIELSTKAEEKTSSGQFMEKIEWNRRVDNFLFLWSSRCYFLVVEKFNL